MSDLPPVERLQAVTVEPGDTIIATVPRETMLEHTDRVLDHLQEKFPNNQILILAGIELWVGHHPKEQT